MSSNKKNAIIVTVKSNPEIVKRNNDIIELRFKLERNDNPTLFEMYNTKVVNQVTTNNTSTISPSSTTVSAPITANKNIKLGNIVKWKNNNGTQLKGKIITNTNDNTNYGIGSVKTMNNKPYKYPTLRVNKKSVIKNNTSTISPASTTVSAPITANKNIKLGNIVKWKNNNGTQLKGKIITNTNDNTNYGIGSVKTMNNKPYKYPTLRVNKKSVIKNN